MSRRDDRHTFDDFAEDAVGQDIAPVEERSRFRVDEELARGGLGRVHKAYDRGLDRVVAVKALLQSSSATRARFQREALLTARLQHPNIVPVYDAGLDDEGEPFLAMRLVRGRSLTEAIDEAPSLEQRLQLLPHVIDACNAIAYAHSERIAHRDLKPDNILVGAFGETVVIDWGLAKDLDADDDPTARVPAPPTVSGLHSNASLTRLGSVVGTPAYMPPEQASGKPVQERADVYSLGAVLYHALAGRRPYADIEDGDAVELVLSGPPTPLDQVVAGAPPDLQAVVSKAMARDPEARYGDAMQLAAELERFQNGRFVSAYDYTLGERVWRTIRAHPVPVALAVALVVITLGGIAALARANQVVEMRRAEAVAARVALAEVQAADRHRAEILALEQAELLALSNPVRSLELLSTVEEHPFDGRIRSIASAILSTRPPQRLRLLEGTEPLVTTALGKNLAAARGTQVQLHTPGGVRTVALPAKVKGLAPLSASVLACTEEGLILVRWSGETEPLDGSSCYKLRSLDDHSVMVRIGSNIARVDPEGRISSKISISDQGSYRSTATPNGAYLWVQSLGGGGLHLYDLPGGKRMASVASSEQSYGLVASPDTPELLFLADEPSLSVASFDGTRLRMRAIDVDLGWLEVGAWVGSTHVLVGGSDPVLALVDLAREQVVERVTLDGSPVELQTLRDGSHLLLTDTGSVFRVYADGDSVLLDPLPGMGEQAQMLEVDGSLLLTTVTDAYRVALDRQDGQILARLGSRVYGIREEQDGSLLVHGAFGVRRLTPHGDVEMVQAIRTYRMVECGGDLWFSMRDGVTSERGAHVVVDGKARALACNEDRGWLAVGTAQGEGILYDVRANEVLRRWADDGANGIIQLRFDGDVLMVVGGGVSHIEMPHGTPDFTMRSEGAFFSTFVGDVAVFANERGRLRTGEGASLPLPSQVFAVGSDGTELAGGDVSGNVYYWPSLDAEPMRLRGHSQYIDEVAFRPGGRWMATGSWDETARLFDLSTPVPTSRELQGHDDAVLALGWARDGSRLFTGDRAGVVRGWSDGLATDPAELRTQVIEMAAALEAGRPLPTLTELQTLVQ